MTIQVSRKQESDKLPNDDPFSRRSLCRYMQGRIKVVWGPWLLFKNFCFMSRA